MEDINKELIDEIAEKTDGFSGREIMKMAVAWHDAAFATTGLTLTPQIMMKVLDKFQLQHKLKETWTKDEELLFGKMTDLTEEMKGHNKTDAHHMDESVEKQSQDLIEKISGQRLEIKNLRKQKKKSKLDEILDKTEQEDEKAKDSK